ncbi:MAG: MlaE family lipid ABC transporter permease subunit [candidate division NC10 bacterium]
MRILGLLGRWTLNSLREGGRMVVFLGSALFYTFLPPLKWRRIIARIHFIGAKSLLVIVVTGAFTGMVLGLQVFYTLRKFGSEGFLGSVVALTLIRELGPVLCALMVTGRAGSALTAEIGIMRITEQIDALDAMALNPMRYLIVPSILAGLIVFPLLTAIFDLVGIYGGYLVGVKLLGVAGGTYFGEMETYVDLRDITQGFLKSLSFGLLMTWVCCYKGFTTSHGAEGVSRATTQAVVLSSVLILVWDYFLGSVLL